MTNSVAIYNLQGQRISPCFLRDISDSGARLALDVDGDASRIEIPQEFILSITRTGNVARLCQLIWRADDQFGVRFEARN